GSVQKHQVNEIAWFRPREDACELRGAQVRQRFNQHRLYDVRLSQIRQRLVDDVQLQRLILRLQCCAYVSTSISNEACRRLISASDLGQTSDEVTVPVRVMNEQVDVARQSVSKPHP